VVHGQFLHCGPLSYDTVWFTVNFTLWSSELRHRVVHGQFLHFGTARYDTVWFTVNFYTVVLGVTTLCGSW